MICPTCSARSITLMAWPGRRTPPHGQPNLIAKYRCEGGHSFQTVSIFDGARYEEHYAPFLEIMSRIVVCWD